MRAKKSLHNLTDEDREYVAAAIAKLRNDSQMNQKELVTRLGEKPNGQFFSPKYVSMVEQKKLVPSRLFMEMLMDKFDTQIVLPLGKVLRDFPVGNPNARGGFTKDGTSNPSGPHATPRAYVRKPGNGTTARKEQPVTADVPELQSLLAAAPQIPVYLEYNAEKQAVTITIPKGVKAFVRHIGTPIMVQASDINLSGSPPNS